MGFPHDPSKKAMFLVLSYKTTGSWCLSGILVPPILQNTVFSYFIYVVCYCLDLQQDAKTAYFIG